MQQRCVLGLIERKAGIVCHTAVHTHIGANIGDVFDSADRVQGDACVPDDGAARLDDKAHHGQLFGSALLPEIVDHSRDIGVGLDCGVLIGIADTEAARRN